MVPGSIDVASVVWSRVLTKDLVRVSSSLGQLQEGVQGEAPRRQAGLRGKRLGFASSPIRLCLFVQTGGAARWVCLWILVLVVVCFAMSKMLVLCLPCLVLVLVVVCFAYPVVSVNWPAWSSLLLYMMVLTVKMPSVRKLDQLSISCLNAFFK